MKYPVKEEQPPHVNANRGRFPVFFVLIMTAVSSFFGVFGVAPPVAIVGTNILNFFVAVAAFFIGVAFQTRYPKGTAGPLPKTKRAKLEQEVKELKRELDALKKQPKKKDAKA